MIKRVLSIGIVILGLACPGAGRAQPVSGAIRVVRQELPSARIEVTGKGYPPKRNISGVQKRLLAKRAAIVDAYRVMTATLNGVSGFIVGGSGYLQTSGFIRGAEVSCVRYFTDGKVEVDLILPVILAQPLHARAGQGRGVGKKVTWDSIVSDISRKGYPVYYTEGQTKQITEEEWLELQSKK